MGAISLPMFCRKLRRNSLRRVSAGSSSSLCFSVAKLVKSARSGCECEGMLPDIVQNSHRALRQLSSGGTWSLRRREFVCSAGSGEVFASTIGEYISRFVTISITFPFSFLVLVATIDRVKVSGASAVGRFDFSRSMT